MRSSAMLSTELANLTLTSFEKKNFDGRNSLILLRKHQYDLATCGDGLHLFPLLLPRIMDQFCLP